MKPLNMFILFYATVIFISFMGIEYKSQLFNNLQYFRKFPFSGCQLGFRRSDFGYMLNEILGPENIGIHVNISTAPAREEEILRFEIWLIIHFGRYLEFDVMQCSHSSEIALNDFLDPGNPIIANKIAALGEIAVELQPFL